MAKVAEPLASKSSPIVIIGAGVFGLSSAIHLAERGFENITVLDKQPYHETKYSFENGCDAASADTNKVIRAAYGERTLYQNLALGSIREWHAWNASLRSTPTSALPEGLTQNDTLFAATGVFWSSSASSTPPYTLSDFDVASLENISRAGHAATQYRLLDPAEVARAKQDGYAHAIDPFRRVARGEEPHQGILDGLGGFVYADKAMLFALHRARSLGIHLVLDPKHGNFSSFQTTTLSSTGKAEEKEKQTITGVVTADGYVHAATCTILATGALTASLVPREDTLDDTLEATAGSLGFIQLPPPSSSSSLWDRFAPENFPTWCLPNGLYGFPRTEKGVIKLGYRGVQWTNPIPIAPSPSSPPSTDKQTLPTPPKKERSTPITAHTTPSLASIPAASLAVMNSFLSTHLPELQAAGIGISRSRLCWYTDTFDAHYVVAPTPSTHGLVVATGGSGHAFKMLPVLGGYVADLVEGQRGGEELRAWAWRERGTEKVGVVNRIGEGASSERALKNVEMAGVSQ
ncbi:MAG: hypothetical protein M1819_001916 [Sarea resinae]|nr:MAG: hypothetical protein M1819_001916 [Sarea resinae]